MAVEGRSVFGYFTDRTEAEAAQAQLKKAGFGDTQLDELHRAGGVNRTTPAISGRFGSLSRLTLGADTEFADEGILLAADPSASGLASADMPLQGKSWVVVAVTDGSDRQVERAVKILKSHGGDV